MAREVMDRKEFNGIFERAVVLCGGQADGDGWQEQRDEWWAWFSRVEAPILRRAFPMMLKAINPDRGERYPSFVRMRVAVDALVKEKRRVERNEKCDLCADGVVYAKETSDGQWMRADRKSRDPKRFRCVCDAGGKVTADLHSVVRILPLRECNTGLWTHGGLSSLVRRCMQAGKHGASAKQLEEIADNFVAERSVASKEK